MVPSNYGQYRKLGVAGFEELVRRRPWKPKLHFFLGLSYLDAGRYDDARRSFEQALVLKTNYREAQAHLGATLLELGCYQEAVEALSAVLDPSRYQNDLWFDDRVYFWLATALTRLERYREAAQAALASLKRSPGAVPVHRLLADLSVYPDVTIPRPANFRLPFFDGRHYFATHGGKADCRLRLFRSQSGTVALLSSDDQADGPGPVLAAEAAFSSLLKQADRYGIPHGTLIFVAHFNGILGQQLSFVQFRIKPRRGKESLLHRLLGLGAPAAAPMLPEPHECSAVFRPMSMKDFEGLTGFRLEWEVEAGAV